MKYAKGRLLVFISEMVSNSINENVGATVRSLQWNVTTKVTLISIKLNCSLLSLRKHNFISSQFELWIKILENKADIVNDSINKKNQLKLNSLEHFSHIQF